jgi:hypothetical protein
MNTIARTFYKVVCGVACWQFRWQHKCGQGCTSLGKSAEGISFESGRLGDLATKIEVWVSVALVCSTDMPYFNILPRRSCMGKSGKLK